MKPKLVDLNEIFKENSTIFFKNKPAIEKKITKITILYLILWDY